MRSTIRNSYLAFEDFAKQLCEKIICPNLLEQTGPVAGGDGKVDTQSFPVSEQCKTLWYVGVNDNSNSDRWAFAVSTQETWKAKCKKDVRKIKETNRGYKKIFCITNRYAKADQRSHLEDELSKETGIDVRILDLSWILDQVFRNKLEKLAIETLSIDIEWRRDIEIGSSDYSKNKRLDEIKLYIKDNVDPSSILSYQLDLMLEEAVLSKELEHSFIESQGLFDRAILASKRHGNEHQSFNCHYQYCWASYWWYENKSLFEENFFKCFDIALEINNSDKWGSVVSLLFLYSTYNRDEEGNLNNDMILVVDRVSQHLKALSLKDMMPSNSLMSSFYLEMLKLLKIQNVNPDFR
ncbi:hypothetical protein [Enterovibrio norvegicus]|uniref:hypothetical protein n=1 Tax=Enterovibrio norvegicus TaxID=188144 RepID=UPI0024B0BF9A|nr:hypothetical protein [Enterovibrio norvegicus]